MKNLILIITFFIIKIVSFTAQQVDESSIISAFLSNALSDLGIPYSQSYRMKSVYFDCSSYVNRMIVASRIVGVINNCNVKMEHASQEKSKLQLLTANLCTVYYAKYIGATSITDILKANRLTP